MKNQGVLLILSGFSGSGKGTIMKRLMEKYDNYALSISATTRNPRIGEEEGREYFFKSVEQFEQMIRDGAFLEYARYVNNYYGTPKAYVEEQMAAGKDVILEIELQGALQVKEIMPEAVLVFTAPPSAAILEDRLRGRGTETDDVIQSRLSRAAEESEYMEQYDYILINDVLEDAVDTLHNLIQVQHLKTANMNSYIKNMKQEVYGFSKGE